MASTRSTTGSSRPRIHATIDSGPERKRRTTATTGAKRGRKPGSTTKTSSVTGAGVKKRGRPAGSTNKATAATGTHHKRKSHLSDKVEGVADKIVGTVTHRPGKKAAGTKKIRGTDGKNSRGRKARV
ncbi:hypothetical protein JX265_012300 [Neoarthrinium moseri]|uniref:Uncharacterized protein n=1 Tax=Neoarthrinium moseri TaxID=1658444 RepID=A0A9P9WAS9_9PEZI|nr:uncharacterized protein JN550_004385 [Neoarthrinium moseri]KAI1849834.1 hypothetical protein JX266_004783 [Neoarthrinium moseri]KAI1855112.1 hypothetical protein JX265_012300 [Neoarthrinium moseri]KAI1871391.1 hypothetical protein JN550_004385 [Neoarthrinium moseri]